VEAGCGSIGPHRNSPRWAAAYTIRMSDSQYLKPGDPAPLAGYYQAHDAHRSPVAQIVAMRKGDQLPPLPPGFMWVRMEKW
jgi:hypothetical protein